MIKTSSFICLFFLTCLLSFPHPASSQRLSASIYHSINICSGTTAMAWGGNAHGAVGDSTLIDRSSPVAVHGLTGIKSVVTGAEHTLVLLDDSTVWAFGLNGNGQLGDSTWVNKNYPVQVHGLTGVVNIGAGGNHSFAIRADGTCWGWGQNGSGQLGVGGNSARLIPTQVSGLTNVVAATGGHLFSIFLLADSSVWGTGDKYFGQLANGSSTGSVQTPILIQDLPPIIKISSGAAFSLALAADGIVWAWGNNASYQLGNGQNSLGGCNCVDTVAPVHQLTGAIDIGTGGGHSLALKSDGTVWAWGQNTHGQIGDSTVGSKALPVQVHDLTDVAAIGAGSVADHSLALKNDGTTWAWGQNYYGQLGNGTTNTTGCQCVREPQQVMGTCITAVSINEPEENKKVVRCYPNPTQGLVTIETTNGTTPGRIIVYSLTGRKVHEENVANHSGTFQFNMSELPQGIYLVDCLFEKSSEKIKVVRY